MRLTVLLLPTLAIAGCALTQTGSTDARTNPLSVSYYTNANGPFMTDLGAGELIVEKGKPIRMTRDECTLDF